MKKEIRRTVLWHESIKKAKNLMEIQEIRDDMVEEIRKDGLVTGFLEKMSKESWNCVCCTYITAILLSLLPV